jgi:hypothetical protein
MVNLGGRRGSVPGGLVVAGITLIALAFRLPSFGDSLWGDDLSTNYVVNGFGIGGVVEIVRSNQEATPPLFFALTWLTKGFDGTEGLRLISLLAGAGAIPLTYLLGVRTVGRPAALVGSLLIALAPLQIYYSTEARAYALAMFLSLLASLMLLIALERGRLGWWIAYALSVGAAAYTHFTCVFVLLGLFCWALVARPQARTRVVLANLAAALLFAPWIPQLLDDRHKPAAKLLEVIHPLNFDRATGDVTTAFLGHPHVSAGQIPGDLALWLIAGGLAIGAGAALCRLFANGGGWRPSSGLILILILAIATPVGLALHNVFAPNLYIPRNLIASAPALALAVGALVTAGGTPLRFLSTGLLLAGFVIGAAKLLDDENRRPDFKAVADFVERTGQPGAPVIDVGPFTPGPQTPLEAAFAPKGKAAPSGRPVMTLGFPTLTSRLDALRGNGGGGLFLFQPIPADEEIASTAARIAGTGKVFLVEPAYLDADKQQRVDRFLAALPPRFRETESRVFPGFGIYEITVRVLQG